MKHSLNEVEGIQLVELGEDIVTENVEEFDAIIRGIIENSKYKIILNLKNVNFMCSSGLGVIVAGFKSTRENDGDIKITFMNDRIRRLFEITRLNKVISEYDNNEQAIKSF